MYGTVGRLRIKIGHLSNLTDVIRELEANPGVQAMSIVGKDDSEVDYYWTIVWTDKATHDANGERPEAAAQYARLLATLVDEPEWHSGEITYMHREGTE